MLFSIYNGNDKQVFQFDFLFDFSNLAEYIPNKSFDHEENSADCRFRVLPVGDCLHVRPNISEASTKQPTACLQTSNFRSRNLPKKQGSEPKNQA